MEKTKTESLLDEICKFYRLKNYAELAIKLDVQLQTVTQWAKRNSLGTAIQNLIEFIRSQDLKFSLDEFFFYQRSFGDDLTYQIPEKIKTTDPTLIKIFLENKNIIIELLAKKFVKEIVVNQILQKEYAFEYDLISKLEDEKDELLNWALNNVCHNDIPEYLNQTAYKNDKMLWRERVYSYCMLEAERHKNDNYMNYLYNTLSDKLNAIELRQANIIIAAVNIASLFDC